LFGVRWSLNDAPTDTTLELAIYTGNEKIPCPSRGSSSSAPYLLKHRRPVIPYTVRRKNFRASNGENTLVFKQEYRKCGSSVRFSNPALHFRQECSFFKSNTAFAAAVLPFQILAFAAVVLLF